MESFETVLKENLERVSVCKNDRIAIPWPEWSWKKP